MPDQSGRVSSDVRCPACCEWVPVYGGRIGQHTRYAGRTCPGSGSLPDEAGRLLSPVIFCECGCGGRRCTYCGVVGETTECATCAEVAP